MWSRRPTDSASTGHGANRPLVVVPIGAFEQHGPHLPLDTDTVIASALVAGAVASLHHATREHVFVAPPVAMSASDEHLGFAGTVSAGTEATMATLVGIARSVSEWACGTLFVNGHGGNSDALTGAHHALTTANIVHALWWPRLHGGTQSDLHAGFTETSVMLHLDPGAVDVSRIEPGVTGDVSDLIERMRRGGVRSVSPNGVIGDPTGATADHGARIFSLWVTDLADTIATHHASWSTARR